MLLLVTSRAQERKAVVDARRDAFFADRKQTKTHHHEQQWVGYPWQAWTSGWWTPSGRSSSFLNEGLPLGSSGDRAQQSNMGTAETSQGLPGSSGGSAQQSYMGTTETSRSLVDERQCIIVALLIGANQQVRDGKSSPIASQQSPVTNQQVRKAKHRQSQIINHQSPITRSEKANHQSPVTLVTCGARMGIASDQQQSSPSPSLCLS